MASCTGYLSLHRPTAQDLADLVSPGTHPMSMAQVKHALSTCNAEGFKPRPHPQALDVPVLSPSSSGRIHPVWPIPNHQPGACDFSPCKETMPCDNPIEAWGMCLCQNGDQIKTCSAAASTVDMRHPWIRLA